MISGGKWVKTGGQNGPKRPKMGISSDKSKYKCHFQVVGHMRGKVDVEVTWFVRSSKFNSFGGV